MSTSSASTLNRRPSEHALEGRFGQKALNRNRQAVVVVRTTEVLVPFDANPARTDQRADRNRRVDGANHHYMAAIIFRASDMATLPGVYGKSAGDITEASERNQRRVGRAGLALNMRVPIEQTMATEACPRDQRSKPSHRGFAAARSF